MIIRSKLHTYRRIFIFASIPFGIYMGSIGAIASGPWYGLLIGVGSGLFYGLFMALILGAMNQFLTKQLKTDYNENLLGVHQVQLVTLKHSFEDAITACQSSLLELKYCTITHTDMELGVIHAQTKTTWKSFGEKIMLTVSTAEPDLCKITISSRPALKTTLVDYGKNVENVRSIINSLRSRGEVAELQIESNQGSIRELTLDATAGPEAAGEKLHLNSEERELLP